MDDESKRLRNEAIDECKFILLNDPENFLDWDDKMRKWSITMSEAIERLKKYDNLQELFQGE